MTQRGLVHERAYRGETNEWYTPPSVFDALGITFDLDPCSPGLDSCHVPARKCYTIEDDGLSSPWHGTVFVNPPYGPDTGVWLDRLAEHGDGIALVFARTDTKWFNRAATRADLVCFTSGRVRFFKGDLSTQPGTPGAGSALLAFGAVSVAALRNSGLGLCFQVVK